MREFSKMRRRLLKNMASSMEQLMYCLGQIFLRLFLVYVLVMQVAYEAHFILV